ncbi:MAG: branched-chain amino acid ABC transporter permease [Alphaproteobacteria bacterium]|jgi:branched-chain amino acid transport system permease protein|nr:branched-chain amino acid ABC transporter permease [Alphaproteobacteria bacterium]|tara:strand:- start:40 stop:1119 length:1080 start_codon:yes stop_codon:yes gene_type:complete
MLYRGSGQFKSTYAQDQAIFPLAQDRWACAAALVVAFVVVPLWADEYWLQAILIPFLVFALLTIGLNILVGYCGQLSLGTGAFASVGAISTYKLTTAFPDLNMIVVFLLSGLITAFVGIVFGSPSLRIKGFYLAVATLAAQFFINWISNRMAWFYNYSPSGSITAPPRKMFGVMVTGPEASAEARYLLTLGIVMVLALLAKNLVRGHLGRSWMAIRDRDIAAELIGIRPLPAKLMAFAISSFYIGVAGALSIFTWLGGFDIGASFRVEISFQVLFMVIVGGMGSILGSFMGAAFITSVPILLTNLPPALGLQIDVALLKHLEVMFFGALIIFFLAVEPGGLARLWQIAKEKLRLWPFPH